MSTTGFYFLSDTPFPDQAKIEFVVSFARERVGGMVELVRGTGRCVRVEKLPKGSPMRFGIGVHIEKHTSLLDKKEGARKGT